MVAMKIAWLEPRPMVSPFGNHFMYSISIIMIPNAPKNRKSAYHCRRQTSLEKDAIVSLFIFTLTYRLPYICGIWVASPHSE